MFLQVGGELFCGRGLSPKGAYVLPRLPLAYIDIKKWSARNIFWLTL